MFHFKEGLDDALFLQAIQYAKCNQGSDTCNRYDSLEPQENVMLTLSIRWALG